MRQWVEGLVGPDYALPTIVAVAAVIALFVLLLVWRLLRGGGSTGTHIAGGRNRKARLAVMDATAIDNYRRLVLVRRDDVEHLLLIGGSADVVVESNIRLGASSVRPAAVQDTIYDQPDVVPEPPPPPPVMRPQPTARPTPPPPRPQPRVEPARPTYIAPTPRASPAPATRVTDDAFDDDLLRELEVELDAGSSAPRNQSIDDEMSKLLGDLSPERR